MRDHRGTALLLFSLLAIAATLALPDRRRAPVVVPTQTVPPARPEEVAFAALVANDSSREQGALAPDERRRMVRELRALGRPALVSFLAGAVGETVEEGPRLVALECLEDCATGREVLAMVRLATPGDAAPTPRLGVALRSALVKTLARDARAFGELVAAWRGAGAELRAELLAAVGERGDPAGLEFLAWVAAFEGERLHRALADTCLRIAPRSPGAEARRDLEALCVLLRSRDGVCVQTISVALARARVEAAIPAWIDLIASDSGGTRARARRSLVELTGLDNGPTRERWLAWYESEVEWFEQQAPLVLSELESDDDGRVLAALRSLSRHRLHRDELSGAVARLLDHETIAVRLCACSALQGLGSPSALPHLAAALADEDESVARGAWSALRRLTGLELPLDEALWREQIAGS